MSEALRSDRSEVRIVEKDVTDEFVRDWMQEFNDSFGTDSVWDDFYGSKVRYAATVRAEQWLEQGFKGNQSPYFELKDVMGPEGWVQTITGEVFGVEEVHVSPEVGGGKVPVIVMRNAHRLLPDGQQERLSDGLFVFIELDKLADDEIQLDPMVEGSAA